MTSEKEPINFLLVDDLEENLLALEALLQLLGDLAVLAGDEDFHGNKSASISSLPT